MDLDRSEIEYQYHSCIIVDRIILKITIIIYKLIVSSQTSEKFLRDTTFLQTKFKVQKSLYLNLQHPSIRPILFLLRIEIRWSRLQSELRTRMSRVVERILEPPTRPVEVRLVLC